MKISDLLTELNAVADNYGEDVDVKVLVVPRFPIDVVPTQPTIDGVEIVTGKTSATVYLTVGPTTELVPQRALTAMRVDVDYWRKKELARR